MSINKRAKLHSEVYPQSRIFLKMQSNGMGESPKHCAELMKSNQVWYAQFYLYIIP